MHQGKRMSHENVFKKHNKNDPSTVSVFQPSAVIRIRCVSFSVTGKNNPHSYCILLKYLHITPS